MGVFKKYAFAKRRAYKQNTFIGGVAGTINTKALLASKLGISEANIKMFEVRGSDIRAHISSSYTLLFESFYGLNMTYFVDKNGLVTNNNGGTRGTNKFKGYFPGIINEITPAIFQNGFQGKTLILKNCLSVPNNYCGNGSGELITLVLSKCTSFGENKLRNNVFTHNNYKVYAPISEQTSNAGAPDGDLSWLVANGGTVIYVPNTTPPAKITTLSIGTKTATTLQLNFTAPTSLNTIANYEVFIDEIPHQIISGSGQYITGLTTATLYKRIEVRAIDQYYNRAEQMDDANMVEAMTL